MKKILIICAIVVIVVSGGAFAIWRHNVSSKNSTPLNVNTQGNTAANPKTNAGANQGSSDPTKNSTTSSSEPTSTSTPTTTKLNPVSVVIVDASQYSSNVEVRGYIAGVSETGSCTIKFSQGTANLTRTVTASPNNDTSACTTLDVPVADFPTLGTWTVSITYSSATSTGTSPSQNVELK